MCQGALTDRPVSGKLDNMSQTENAAAWLLSSAERELGEGNFYAAVSDLLDVQREAERLMLRAVQGMHGQGKSWDYIGAQLGVTRQAAHERWAHRLGDVEG